MSYKIEISPHLPFEKFISFCDIQTKREFREYTGEIVNCLKIGNKILLSQELYEKFKKEYKDKPFKI
ncbi:hypothetical protein V9L05_15315 [Bernardetia sp. Wsw4-3y2]|uniref:hypothetical protein n=1 Tax=Bernardetia sp. Wsw4-3y2 TaxID=3127471 RepID=UPI0030D2A4C6